MQICVTHERFFTKEKNTEYNSLPQSILVVVVKWRHHANALLPPLPEAVFHCFSRQLSTGALHRPFHALNALSATCKRLCYNTVFPLHPSACHWTAFPANYKRTRCIALPARHPFSTPPVNVCTAMRFPLRLQCRRSSLFLFDFTHLSLQILITCARTVGHGFRHNTTHLTFL